LVLVIAALGWLVALVVSIASAAVDWHQLTSAERDRVVMMTVSWLALPAIAVLVARGYLSESASESASESPSACDRPQGSRRLRIEANRSRIRSSKPESEGS
jgi:hypothetical protein